MKRVLLIAPHSIIRKRLREVLLSDREIEIVGETSDENDVLRMVLKVQPTMIIMDITAPEWDAIRLIRAIKSQYPDITVVGLFIYCGKRLIKAALEAGAVLVETNNFSSEGIRTAMMRENSCQQLWY